MRLILVNRVILTRTTSFTPGVFCVHTWPERIYSCRFVNEGRNFATRLHEPRFVQVSCVPSRPPPTNVHLPLFYVPHRASHRHKVSQAHGTSFGCNYPKPNHPPAHFPPCFGLSPIYLRFTVYPIIPRYTTPPRFPRPSSLCIISLSLLLSMCVIYIYMYIYVKTYLVLDSCERVRQTRKRSSWKEETGW